VLTNQRIRESQAVGQDYRLAVLFQRLGVVAARRVHGHGKKSELHRFS
jgi:hypothetical protein